MRRDSTNDGDRKTPLSVRLVQVRKMVERAEAARVQYEDVGLIRLAQEKAREKRYWQFVQAVLELGPWMGQTQGKHTIH